MIGQAKADRQVERVVFQTDLHVVVGDVTLPPPDGYQSRFSDVMNRREFPFIPLVNAEITERETGRSEHRAFVLLSKERVNLAYPLDGNA